MYTLSSIFLLCIISTSNAQSNSKSTNPQRYFNYNVNPYVSAQVEGGSDDKGSVSLEYHGNIYKKDNFKVSVKYVNDEGATISHVVKVTNLCDQLDIELQGDQPFKLGDILGLSGIRCPILVSDINEKFEAQPMKWYSQYNLPEKIKCGVHSYHATLYKCGSDGNDCNVLLESGVKSLLISDDCEERDEQDEVDDEEEEEVESDEQTPSLPIDLSSDIRVSKLSKSRLTDANANKVEVIDHSSNGETVGIINTADLTDQEVNEVNLVDEQTGEKYNVLNSEVNNVRVVNAKVTNYNQNSLNGNFDENDNDNDDDDDYDNNEDDNDYDNNEDDDRIYNPGPPETRVTQVKTKGNSVTHLEKIEDHVGDLGIFESQEERDLTVDSESNNVAIETHNGNQNNKFSSSLGSIIMGNKVKSNLVLHTW